jgi:short chain enoyl-CoA hydratase (EC 4.2.1.17)/3-hydroxyacyl-CoA dehydrogenase (EC 1.1.1.35)
VPGDRALPGRRHRRNRRRSRHGPGLWHWFPPFRGGALRYIDSIGVAEFVALADQYADLGPLYHPTAKLREMAKNGQRFFN